jgi:hypothetical protein
MFRAGQKVVCADADGAPMLTLNGVYTIHSIDPPEKRRWRNKIGVMIAINLYEAKPQDGMWGFAPERFRPAVDRKTDISLFTKMLSPNATEGV